MALLMLLLVLPSAANMPVDDIYCRPLRVVVTACGLVL